MKLYMIRHGQTTCNVAGKHQGWGPVSLSEKGFEQARKAKEYVRTVNYDKIFVSDLLRARQTAEILFPEKYRAGELEFTEDLREIDTGVFFGRTFDDVYPIYGDVYLDCRKKMDYSALGGESSLDVKRRVQRFLDHVEAMEYERLGIKEPDFNALSSANMKSVNMDNELKRSGELKIAAVAHGGIIRAAASIIAGFPEDCPFGYFPLQILNCSVSVFNFSAKSGRWEIEKLNYTGTL